MYRFALLSVVLVGVLAATVVADHPVHITSPVSNETVWKSGEAVRVTWQNQPKVKRVAVFYHLGHGDSLKTLGAEVPSSAGGLNFTVPTIDAAQASRIYITVQNIDKKKQRAVTSAALSGANGFTITAPAHNGVLKQGQNVTITWTTTGTVADVDIDAINKDGKHVSLAKKVPNTGSFTFTVKKKLSQIEISDSANHFVAGFVSVKLQKDKGGDDDDDDHDHDHDEDDHVVLLGRQELDPYDYFEAIFPEDGDFLFAGIKYALMWAQSEDVKAVAITVVQGQSRTVIGTFNGSEDDITWFKVPKYDAANAVISFEYAVTLDDNRTFTVTTTHDIEEDIGEIPDEDEDL